jgi:hypothetical protein
MRARPAHPPEDSGFFKALEEGKSEEEALAIAQGGGQPTAHSPYEPARVPRAAAAAAAAPAGPVVAPSVIERRAAPSYGFAARHLH